MIAMVIAVDRKSTRYVSGEDVTATLTRDW